MLKFYCLLCVVCTILVSCNITNNDEALIDDKIEDIDSNFNHNYIDTVILNPDMEKRDIHVTLSEKDSLILTITSNVECALYYFRDIIYFPPTKDTTVIYMFKNEKLVDTIDFGYGGYYNHNGKSYKIPVRYIVSIKKADVEISRFDNAVSIGDTLKVPITNSIPHYSLECNSGSINNDTLFIPIDTQSMGPHDFSIKVFNDNKLIDTLNGAYHVFPFNKLAIGEEWVICEAKWYRCEGGNHYDKTKLTKTVVNDITLENDKSIYSFKRIIQVCSTSTKDTTEYYVETAVLCTLDSDTISMFDIPYDYESRTYNYDLIHILGITGKGIVDSYQKTNFGGEKSGYFWNFELNDTSKKYTYEHKHIGNPSFTTKVEPSGGFNSHKMGHRGETSNTGLKAYLLSSNNTLYQEHLDSVNLKDFPNIEKFLPGYSFPE